MRVNSQKAAMLGIIFSLPFAFGLFTAISQFKPFLNIIAFQGRATTPGLILFYIGMIGLPLAAIVNFLPTKKKPINWIILAVAGLIFIVFGGHLLIDQIACFAGNVRACD